MGYPEGSDILMGGLNADKARAQLTETRSTDQNFVLTMQGIAREIRVAIVSGKQGHMFVYLSDDFFYRDSVIDELKRRGFSVESDERQPHKCRISW